MSLRLSRGEYWLLVRAVEYRIPLPCLALPEGPPWHRSTIQMAFNRQGHGLSLDELVETLHAFVVRGWITITSDGDACGIVDTGAIRDAFECETRDDACYALTVDGGRVWEAFARPKWDRYIDHTEDGTDGDERDPQSWCAETVIAPSRIELDRYLHTLSGDYDFEPGSTHRDIVDDWQPIYWRPAQIGHRCRFRCRLKAHVGRLSHAAIQHRDAWLEWR